MERRVRFQSTRISPNFVQDKGASYINFASLVDVGKSMPTLPFARERSDSHPWFRLRFFSHQPSLSWTLVEFSVGLCVVVSRVYDSVLGEHSNSVVSDGLAFKLCRDAADFPLFSLASREGRLFGSLDP